MAIGRCPRRSSNIGGFSRVSTVTPGLDASAVTQAGAIYNPGEGWVDLPSLIGLLLEEFAGLGGALVSDQGVASVVIEGGSCRRCRDGGPKPLCRRCRAAGRGTGSAEDGG